MIRSSFLFTTCQAGGEAALKKELARIAPELRLAYSRPGFVTFKRAEGGEFTPDYELNSVFARTYGVSLGRTPSDPDQVIARASEISGQEGSPLRLHFWVRDRYAHRDAPPDYVPGQLSETELEHRDRLLADPVFRPDPLARPGDLVLDVAVVEDGEWWIGCHRHSEAHSPYPGGRPEIDLPAESPSRAYLKLEEGILWSGAPIREGDTAVEIGSSPGGASYALLKRGLRVVGIDPRTMDERVLAQPGFKWVRKPVKAVRREELPDSVQWLLLDMNVAPTESLGAVERLVRGGRGMQDTLLGVLLTVKLTNWAFAEEIPRMLERLKGLGMAQVRARQLAYNGQEFLLYGLTRKGSLRRP